MRPSPLQRRNPAIALGFFGRAFARLCGALLGAWATWVHAEADPEAAPAPDRYAFAAPGQTRGALEQSLREGELLRFRAGGNTSLMLEVLLEGGGKAAFKPFAQPRTSGFEAELAAVLIAQALELETVPPAVARRVERDALKDRFVRGGKSRWSSTESAIKWQTEENAPFAVGTLIHWVDGLEDWALERPEVRQAAFEGLRLGEPVPEDPAARQRLRDVSDMLVFDYLIANWDRFSGGNTKLHSTSQRLCIRDHDVAFGTPLPERLHERVLSRLLLTERFSLNTVRALANLDENALRASLSQSYFGAGGGPLLNETQIDDVFERFRTLGSYIASVIDGADPHDVFALEESLTP